MVDFNPYKSPESTPENSTGKGAPKRRVGISLFMILGGTFFCVASFYALFGHGIEGFQIAARESGRFIPLFLIFYGTGSGLTAVFHLAFLLRGRPKQYLAGLYAFGFALLVTFFAAHFV